LTNGGPGSGELPQVHYKRAQRGAFAGGGAARPCWRSRRWTLWRRGPMRWRDGTTGLTAAQDRAWDQGPSALSSAICHQLLRLRPRHRALATSLNTNRGGVRVRMALSRQPPDASRRLHASSRPARWPSYARQVGTHGTCHDAAMPPCRHALVLAPSPGTRARSLVHCRWTCRQEVPKCLGTYNVPRWAALRRHPGTPGAPSCPLPPHLPPPPPPAHAASPPAWAAIIIPLHISAGSAALPDHPRPPSSNG
jgi:hypothetical protein